MWRERIVNNRIGEWVGPHTVASADYSSKIVHAKESEQGLPRPYNFAQVKPYVSATEASRAFLLDVQRSLKGFATEESEDAFLTEVLNPNDPRSSSSRMTDAKRAEIKGIMERGTFKVILREEIPPNGNVLPGRFVLSIKSTENGEEKFKARYVVGGHRDRHEAFMVHVVQLCTTAIPGRCEPNGRTGATVASGEYTRPPRSTVVPPELHVVQLMAGIVATGTRVGYEW